MDLDFIDVDGWDWAFKAALTTVHKSPLYIQPTSNWKTKMLIAEHSPIREVKIRFKFKSIKRWIADQLVRHNVGVNNYMGTGRPDRGNVPRSEQTMEMETMLMQSHNAQSFIREAQTRLCVGCVSTDTRHLMENLVKEVGKTNPEVASVCVPPCVYRHGCKEAFTTCKHYDQFLGWCVSQGIPMRDLSNIKYRYWKYHEWRAFIERSGNETGKSKEKV